jgi:hypothetical protein
MKTRILAILLLSTAAAAFARPPMGLGMSPHRLPIEHDYLRAELDSLFGMDGELGSLSYGELRELAGRLSVARQKDRFVARSKTMSLMMPGSGQFLNKEVGAGAAFLAADLAVVAGTLAGAYFLLPDNLRFQQLDYFHTPFNQIRDAWEGNTFTDYLPSMAMLAGGGLAKAILGQISSTHAGKLARRNIDAGTISFKPDLLVLPDGGMMMGLGWRY